MYIAIQDCLIHEQATFFTVSASSLHQLNRWRHLIIIHTSTIYYYYYAIHAAINFNYHCLLDTRSFLVISVTNLND